VNKFFLSAIACIICINVWAQDSTYRYSSTNARDKKAEKRQRISRMLRMEEEGDLIFNKHNLFGIKVATDGYGIFFEKGKFITPTKTRLLQFELNEKKSPKEKRVSTGDFFTGSSLVLYKLNNFYQFKLSLGEQRLIGGKGNKNGVAVTWLYTGGASLGIIKPYYINAVDTNGVESQVSFIDFINDPTGKYAGATGASGFTVGWGHVSFKPGLNAKAALRFDYARFNTSVTAIEAGVSGEFYFGKIPLVYDVPQKQFFFNGYVTIMFGNRK
jgi:hypothetical protein